MPALTDTSRLLRAVLESPDDDTLRLIYADALEESGEDERAELIRLQIAKEKEGNAWHGFLCLPKAPCKNCRREWRLLTDYGAQIEKEMPFGGLPNEPFMTCHAGMIDSIKVPLPLWMKYGPSLCARHPITKVEVTDKHPTDTRRKGGGSRGYAWFCEDGNASINNHAVIPFCMWTHANLRRWNFPDIASAMKVLSWMCVNWSRGLNHLPPLPFSQENPSGGS